MYIIVCDLYSVALGPALMVMSICHYDHIDCPVWHGYVFIVCHNSVTVNSMHLAKTRRDN